MKIEITQKLTKAYYVEYYGEWLGSRSSFRKWERMIGGISLVLAAMIYIWDDSLYYLSFGLSCWGILICYDFYASRKKWLRERITSKFNDVEFTMIFEEHQFQSLGPFTKTSGAWNFFSDAIETQKGLFLIPENGVSIYLQKAGFQQLNDIQHIINKVKKSSA